MAKPDFARIRKNEQNRLQKACEKETRKRQKIIRITETPLLPALLSALYACMKVFTAISLAVTLLHAFINREGMTGAQAVQNIAVSGSLVFIGFSVPVLLGSVAQLLRLRGSYTEYEYRFEGELGAERDAYEPVFAPDRVTDARLRLYRRAIDAKKRYIGYVKVSGVGIVICIIVLTICVAP